MDKAKIHKIEILVTDPNNQGIRWALDNLRSCAGEPTVLSHTTKTVEWSDDHPLNNSGQKKAFKEAVTELFKD